MIFGLAMVLVMTPALAAAPPVAGDKAGVMAAVNQFIDGFNTGDRKSMLAACATPASIIDDFSPHEWQGPTACADWAKAFDATSKAEGITAPVVTIGTPWHLDVTGDRAYVVAPSTYAYKLRGKPTTEPRSVWTFALRKTAQAWRITGWAWSSGKP